jgi:hypothetical protein
LGSCSPGPVWLRRPEKIFKYFFSNIFYLIRSDTCLNFCFASNNESLHYLTKFMFTLFQ